MEGQRGAPRLAFHRECRGGVSGLRALDVCGAARIFRHPGERDAEAIDIGALAQCQVEPFPERGLDGRRIGARARLTAPAGQRRQKQRDRCASYSEDAASSRTNRITSWRTGSTVRR